MIFVFRDLKIAVRHLSKSPKFSTTAVLMLALAIGATTAIFSLVESVLLRPLPFPEPNRLVVLSDSLLGLNRHSSTVKSGVTAPDIQNYVRDTHSFTSLGGYQSTTYEFSGDAGEPSTINAARMDSGVFPALGVQPLLGRVFTQEEDDKHQQVMLLSYATWQSRFQGDPKILGRKLLLNRKPYLVIGVMPRNFEFPLAPGHLTRSELWVPISLDASELAAASYWALRWWVASSQTSPASRRPKTRTVSPKRLYGTIPLTWQGIASQQSSVRSTKRLFKKHDPSFTFSSLLSPWFF